MTLSSVAVVMGNPVVIAASLRKIAAKIDASKSPSISAVRSDLRKVLAAVQGESRESRIRRIALDMVRLAQEELETSMWDTEEGEDVDFAFGEAKRKTGEKDNLDGALGVLKHKIDTFIKEIQRDPSTAKPSMNDNDDDVVTSAPPKKDLTKKPAPKGPPGPPPKK